MEFREFGGQERAHSGIPLNYSQETPGKTTPRDCSSDTSNTDSSESSDDRDQENRQPQHDAKNPGGLQLSAPGDAQWAMLRKAALEACHVAAVVRNELEAVSPVRLVL